jgi:cobalt-zinc-cadmium resistance protein CzcA
VEKLVSYPIETAMNDLPDIQEVRSISQFGALSAVTVDIQEGTDIYFARQMVSHRLQSVRDELPGRSLFSPIGTYFERHWVNCFNT